MTKFQKVNLEKYTKPSRFFKTKVGDNQIRVLGEPYTYQVVGKKARGRYIRQILDDTKPIEEFLSDVEPKLTYGFIIFDHVTEHFYVLETGVMLGDMLTQLVKEDQENYKNKDIVIGRKGEGLKTEYSVRWADDTKKLPEGLSKDTPEYRYISSYFKDSDEKS